MQDMKCFIALVFARSVQNKHEKYVWVSEFEGCKIYGSTVEPPDFKIFCISIKPSTGHHICIYFNLNRIKCEELYFKEM